MADSPYSDAIIYVMSGTGNSYRLACWIKEIAEREIDDVTLVLLDDSNRQEEKKLSKNTLVGMVFPVHGFMPPWSMLKFLLRMRLQKGVPSFCAATRGGIRLGPLIIPGIAGLATFLAAFLMLTKGYHPRALFSLDMPSNFINFHWGLHKKNVEKISRRSQQKLEQFMPRIIDGRFIYLTLNNLWEMVWSIVMLWLVPIFPIMYLLIGKLFMAKIMFSNNNCIGCGLCARFCPNQAITMKSMGTQKHPYWTYHCEVCLRCMGYCHKGAVEAGHSWAVILYYLGSIPLFTYFFAKLGDVPINLQIADLYYVNETISIANTIAGIILSYWIFWFLIRIPILNTIFTYTTLTHYYRRYHQPETRLKDLSSKRSGSQD